MVEVLPASREEKVQYFLQKVESKVADLIDNSALTVANKKVTPLSFRFHLACQIVMKHKSYQNSYKKYSRGSY